MADLLKKAIKSGMETAFSMVGKKTVKGRLFYNRNWDYEKGGPQETKTTHVPAKLKKAAQPVVKMYMPKVMVEYYASAAKGGTVKKRATVYADKNGRWTVKGVSFRDAYIKVFLFYRGNKVVTVYGHSNWSNVDEFKVKKGKIINSKITLDDSKLKKVEKITDLGEIEITQKYFKPVCDIYNTVVFGYNELRKKSGYKRSRTKVYYPYPPSSAGGGVSNAAGNKMWINELDAQDRAVLLHEWGHTVIDALLSIYTSDASWPGGKLYDYRYKNWDNGHGKWSKEYLESAWNEGVANYFACALSGTPVYYDGYDTDYKLDLKKDHKDKSVPWSAHNEAAIHGALWHFVASAGVDFKKDFWNVLTDTSKRKVRTIWSFFDNYKDSGRPHLKKLIAAYQLHKMKYRFDYLTGAKRYKSVGKPKKFSKKKKQFRRRTELRKAFGSGVKEAEYYEEFFNRNNKFNTGKPPGTNAIWRAGATYKDPKNKVGTSYIVPVRSKAK